MRYVLKIPGTGSIEFPEYKDAMFALSQVRGSLDNIRLEELDWQGNLQNTLQGEELEKVVAEIRGIMGASVLLGKPGRTLDGDE